MAAKKKEFSLAFQLGAKLQSSFPAAFKGAEKHIKALEKAASNTGKAWGEFGKKAGSLAKQVTGLAVAVGGGAFALAQSTAASADAIGKMSEKLGINAERLQAYQYAAELSGMTTDKFNDNMNKFNAVMAKSATSKNDPLNQFGLSAEKIMKLKPEERIMAISDYANKYLKASEKGALFDMLFGTKGGSEMARMFAEGSAGVQKALDAWQKSGKGLTDKQIKEAAEYNDRLTDLKKSIGDVRNAFGTRLVPMFTSGFKRIIALIDRNIDKIKAFADRMALAIENNIPKIEEIAAKMVEFGGKVWDTVQKIKDFAGGWDKLIIGIVIFKTLSTVTAGLNAIYATGVLAVTAIKAAKALLSLQNIKEMAETAALKAMYIKDAVVKAASTAATYAYAAAVKVAAAGQWVLNAAIAFLSTPIGIAVAAIAALVVAFVLAYNKCEWFRDKVDAAIAAVVGIFNTLKDKIPAAFAEAWEKVTAGAAAFVAAIKAKFAPFLETIDTIKNKIASIFSGKKTLNVDVNTAGVPDVPGHASGGIFNRPHMAYFAENAPRVPEAAIPVENTPRSYGLWRDVGEMAGFEAPATITAPMTQRGGDTIHFSPNITQHITGGNPQETAQAVKKANAQSMQELKREFERWMKDREANAGRLSYA